MRAPECIVCDFETMPIKDNRPDYPPSPVGVSIAWPGCAPHYYACGHPTNNNCTPREALTALQHAWDSGLPLLFHHSKFDIAVACEKLGLPEPPWERVHDTMFLAYLAEPHARELGLKELCEDLLCWPAEERNELYDWIWAHREQLEATYGGRVLKSDLGAWIFATPGDLAGRYANGDAKRTRALFEHLWPLVMEHGMGAAYDRERELQPILMENERDGIPVDMHNLYRDILDYSVAFTQAEQWIRRELRAPDLNIDADADVAKLLYDRGIVPHDQWTLTKTGKLSLSKENLKPAMFTGPNGAQIASALGYRNRLATCLKMFMEPWYKQGAQRDGIISTSWNQVRNVDGYGTRTGRPSTSKPNFLNIAKELTDGRSDGYVHPDFLGVAKLPLCRKYILPDPGGVFLHRDFDGQELRGFAHFEQGALWQAYWDNPNLDPHGWIGGIILEQGGRELERTRIKNVTFARLYGGGLPAIHRQARCASLDEAREISALHDAALPGRKILVDEIKKFARLGIPIRTWGGRLYLPEPPGPDGRSKDYKLINYLVQGSAADVTKQALIDWHKARKHRSTRFLVTVYDEINISAQMEHAAAEMAILRECMEVPRLSVPMTTTPKHGATWGASKSCTLPGTKTIDRSCALCGA
jgi:DNA polymerase I-like protein with 3'-5' exonuclease and polymerase domains